MGRVRIVPALLLALAAGFSWLFYERYWKWRECIHEALSSCITPDGESLIAGGMVWALPAGVLTAVALWRMLWR
jgi:hypothetical protein